MTLDWHAPRATINAMAPAKAILPRVRQRAPICVLAVMLRSSLVRRANSARTNQHSSNAARRTAQARKFLQLAGLRDSWPIPHLHSFQATKFHTYIAFGSDPHLHSEYQIGRHSSATT